MTSKSSHPRPNKRRRTRTNLNDEGYASQPAERPCTTAVASQSFELELREQVPEEAIAAPAEASTRATVASDDNEEPADDDLDERFADDFNGICWDRLPEFMKPLRTQKHRKSWIYRHGYRVALRRAPDRLFFICRYCHQHKIIETGGGGKYDVTDSTSTAARHLEQARRGHGYQRDGSRRKPRPGAGQTTLRSMIGDGVGVSQEVANAMGNFNVQGFRLAVITWLVDNNQPLRTLETPAFQEMMRFANPEAANALWTSHNSVARFIMRLYDYMQPQVCEELSNALGKVHISFDGWTVKGGKRGFLGVVAHYVNQRGEIKDLPIALPQLSGAHTGVKIAEVVDKTLQKFSIDSTKLGYFVLDNARSNDVAIATLASTYDFNASHRRVRCGPHTINLIGQTMIWGKNSDAYNNETEHYDDEERFLQDWRTDGPLGVLLEVLSYVKTPQQHELFTSFQHRANDELPTNKRRILEPIKPVMTRWNSYQSAFKRATELQHAVDAYANYHIDKTRSADAYARSRNSKLQDVPRWMRSDGLSAADWAVVTEYVDALRPLKEATKRLEGRGKGTGRYGAIHEVIPVFEYLLAEFEQRATPYEGVDFKEPDAPEDHLAINLRAAWAKANAYFAKLDESPVYYAAVILHPYYKYYCDNSWASNPHWLTAANAAFQKLWAEYKPSLDQCEPVRRRAIVSSGIDNAIDAFVGDERRFDGGPAQLDEFDRWKKYEPRTLKEDYCSARPIEYWLTMRNKYPNLARLAIDVLSVPASSCDCERMFSELGDLLEPRRRQISSQLLAAIQCVRGWIKAGFRKPSQNAAPLLTDDAVDAIYSLCEWDPST